MARRVADSGQRVALIVCYDDLNAYSGLRCEMDESQHFQFSNVRATMANMENIAVELVDVTEALALVGNYLAEGTSTFVVNFTFQVHKPQREFTIISFNQVCQWFPVLCTFYSMNVNRKPVPTSGYLALMPTKNRTTDWPSQNHQCDDLRLCRRSIRLSLGTVASPEWLSPLSELRLQSPGDAHTPERTSSLGCLFRSRKGDSGKLATQTESGLPMPYSKRLAFRQLVETGLFAL